MATGKIKKPLQIDVYDGFTDFTPNPVTIDSHKRITVSINVPYGDACIVIFRHIGPGIFCDNTHYSSEPNYQGKLAVEFFNTTDASATITKLWFKIIK